VNGTPMIELKGVSKSFGATPAVNGVSLCIEPGALCVLIGPSGCGKSTVLRMINAMIAPDAGAVEVRGRDAASFDPTALRRSIGYVIQSVGLFPHWTVAANIGAVPKLLGWEQNRIAGRVEEIAAALQIDRSLLPRYPRELSGGQQQRVGVARALAADPDILLMDEPFAALDPVSRAALQNEVRRLHAASGKTIVFVTHDMNEALRLASQIIVMNAGRVVQSGEPAAILLRPEGDFVRGFLGREDLPLRLLDLSTVGEIARPLAGAPRGDARGSAKMPGGDARPVAETPGGDAARIAQPIAGTPGGDVRLFAQTPGAITRPLAATSDAITPPLPETPAAGALRIAATATLRQALTLILESRSARLLVENGSGDITGEIDIDDIVARHGTT
jgi:osmoprotectant transport system ATP-binding protein